MLRAHTTKPAGEENAQKNPRHDAGALGLWWLAAVAAMLALRGARRRQH